MTRLSNGTFGGFNHLTHRTTAHIGLECDTMMPFGYFNQVKCLEIKVPDGGGKRHQEAPVRIPGIPFVLARQRFSDGIGHPNKDHGCQHARH